MGNSIITVELHEGEVDVHISYWKASRGAREHGTGLQLEPDEPAGFEVDRVEYDGKDVTSIMDINKIEELVEEFYDRQREY